MANPKLELAEQRWKVVSDLLGCIERLANARNALTVEERFALAEGLRDCADEYDRGKVFRPAPEPGL